MLVSCGEFTQLVRWKHNTADLQSAVFRESGSGVVLRFDKNISRENNQFEFVGISYVGRLESASF
jgi:hypothetical protein